MTPWQLFLKTQSGQTYRVFHGFGQAKFADGGSFLGSSQLSILPKLPLKMTLNLIMVKIDPKLI
jgi:hypothetical protein